MLSRIAIAVAVLLIAARSSANAADRDHLQHGEEELTAAYQKDYNRAVRHVLSRGWRKDVVLRMFNVPPFQPESVTGIARTANGYTAFEATVAKNVWYELGFGSEDWKRKKRDYRSIKSILHERTLSEALAARIATLWRRVLADPRNYRRDEAIYLDTDQFSFYLAFLPREQVKAYMTGWGPHTWQLIDVAAAVASHANGAPDGYLEKAVAKAEKKLGI